MAPTELAEQRQYLSFTLGESDYAVGILQFETVTRVPGVPASVRGVINLRARWCRSSTWP